MSLIIARAEKAFAGARFMHHDGEPDGESGTDQPAVIRFGNCYSCGKHCRGAPDKGGRFWHTACVTLAKSSPF